MSVLKLLSRIVKPSNTLGQQASTKTKSDLDRSYGITTDPLVHFACAFCALIHDAQHPGASNAVMAKENRALGERYRNRSVAEQNSLALCFDLMSKSEFKNLRRTMFANDHDQLRFRQIVINSVMATDIFDPVSPLWSMFIFCLPPSLTYIALT